MLFLLHSCDNSETGLYYWFISVEAEINTVPQSAASSQTAAKQINVYDNNPECETLIT